VSKATIRLSSIASTCSGGTPSRSHPEYFGGGIPWVKSGELGSSLITGTEETLSNAGLDNSSAQVLPPGTILVALYGATAGEVGRLGIHAATNQAVLAVRPNDPHDGDFIFHAIAAASRTLLHKRQGGAQPNLNSEMVRSLELYWPDQGTRTQIARAASAFDEAANTCRDAIARKQAFRRGLMTRLMRGLLREPGRSRELTRCPYVGRRPADWRVTALGGVTSPVTRRNHVGCERVLTMSGAKGLIDQQQYFSKLIASETRGHYVLLQRGEFAYNRSRMHGYPYGAVKRLDAYDQGAISTLNICFAIKSDDIDSDYLAYFFEAGLLAPQLRRIAREGARSHGLLNVAKGDFFGLKLVLPSVAEQRFIATTLQRVDAELRATEAYANVIELWKRAAVQDRLLS
jgi:type I restriction enzyme S subunit